MSNKVPSGLLARGVISRGQVDPTPSRSYIPEAPVSLRQAHDTYSGVPLIVSGTSFRGEAFTEPDKARTSTTISTLTTYDSGISSGGLEGRYDSGGLSTVSDGVDLERRMNSMSISEPRSNSQGSKPQPRLPIRGQIRTTRIAEMRNVSSTVQAPTQRSNSPQLTYMSNNPPQPSYHQEQYYPRVPMSSMHPHVQPSYNIHPLAQNSQSPQIDIRTMLQQSIQFFVQDKEGDTGLHLAVIHSQMDLLDRLLYLMTKEPMLQGVIDEQNAMYQTALHLAVHTQQIDMIRKLLLSGASLNVPDHKGNTALHIAAQFSSTKSLEELALYVPLQTLLDVARIRNNEGQTCVHIAAHHGNTDVLRKLKSYGVDIDMQDLKSGKTALHVSVENSSLRDVQFLLETCHANVNATTFTSCTPLHIASGRGDISTVAYLISQGANPYLQTDEGDTALEIAGSEEVNSLLRKAAALKWMY